MPEIIPKRTGNLETTAGRGSTGGTRAARVVLSFDVEEHFLIEAASGLRLDKTTRDLYRRRVGPPTSWLLDLLDQHGIRATFFVVGQVASHDPGLIRDIHQAGHEVASHGWDHRRIHHHSPDSFREDVRRGKDALEQLTGEAVVGYRAPTFSIVARTAWALDVLAELGFHYDSSIYPVRHDRYGVPDAPRGPFLALGSRHEILEVPPLTLRLPGINLPVGGGGYFRLLPVALMRHAIGRVGREGKPPVAMLYFHPWEFDPDQPRLPLRRLSRFRTYVGIGRSRDRLARLLAGNHFVRAIDVADWLNPQRHALPRFPLGASDPVTPGVPAMP